jgi:uracil-DNA glycosylase
MIMTATSIIHPSWDAVRGLLYIEPLKTLTDEVLPNCGFTPQRHEIFNVFRSPVKDIKVVIIGQDPYPNPAMATGYAFHSPGTMKKPPSLRIIEEEIINSDPSNMCVSGKVDLLSWADQGVMLLNSALTTEAGNSGSHLKYWRPFTERVVSFLSHQQPCIWLLWGKNAKSFMPFIKKAVSANSYSKATIDNIPIEPSTNYVLTAPHPMVEIYGSGKFKECDHFYKTNRILTQKRVSKIIW